MKKLLSIALCAALVLSCLISTAVTSSAEETVNDSYKDDFISALLGSEDEWLDSSGSGTLQFIDFNFDGKLEFVVKKDGTSANSYVKCFCFDGNSINEAIMLSGYKDYDFNAYYDTQRQKYVVFGLYSDHSNADPYYYNYDNAEIEFNGINFISEIYSGLRYDGEDYGADDSKFTYYNAQKEVIEKSEYDSINSGMLENCVDINMTYDNITWLDYSSYPQLKKDSLTELYDSFTYDQYDIDDTDTTTNTEKPVGYTAFEDMPKSFIFSYGAGGWSTAIVIEKDGSFSGKFLDNDLGSTGEGYPNGTCYICNFKGRFSEPEQVDEYTYSMKVESLETENTPNDEYYENGIRYLYTEPYGLKNGDDCLFYLPGIRVDSLPDEFMSWYHGVSEEELPCYGLYNVTDGYGFFEDVNVTDSSTDTNDTDTEKETDSNTDTDVPVKKTYTAAELVNKSLQEIVNIMGGEYDIAGNFGNVYISNYDILPGMKFHTTATIADTAYYSTATSAEEDKIRASIKNGDVSLEFILLDFDAKLDDNISTNMKYNDLTKYFGEFSCQVGGNVLLIAGVVEDVHYSLNKATIFFKDDGLDISAGNGEISAETLKSVNPEIAQIIVYPGYVSSTLSSDTDTESSTSSNTSSTTTSTTGTTNTTGGTTTTGKSSDTVTTGGVTYAAIFIVVLAVSGVAVVLFTKKHREN